MWKIEAANSILILKMDKNLADTYTGDINPFG